MKYKVVVCGGTFDLFHEGHKNFLTQVFNHAGKVVIGLTSDLYTSKFKVGISEDFKTRKEKLINFLIQEEVLEKTEIVEIDNIYGPLLGKDFIADAIAVTEETNKTAIEINEERVALGLQSLDVLIFKMDVAQDNKLISSTRIRNGEIDRSGKLFINPAWAEKSFVLPQNLRAKLHEPFGKIINSIPKDLSPDKIITIGDITTQKFNNKKIGHRLSIVDFVVERRKKFSRISDLGFPNNLEVIKVNNSSGQISWDLFQAIVNSFKTDKRKIILVNGEEDLSVLPVILSAPLGYKIYYGQPGEGLVEVEVTEESKEKGFELLSKFNY